MPVGLDDGAAGDRGGRAVGAGAGAQAVEPARRIEHQAGGDEAGVHAVLGGGGEADVDGGGAAFAVLLEDVGAVELGGGGLDHLRVRAQASGRRRRAPWCRARCARDGDERLEERLDLLGALGAARERR